MEKTLNFNKMEIIKEDGIYKKILYYYCFENIECRTNYWKPVNEISVTFSLLSDWMRVREVSKKICGIYDEVMKDVMLYLLYEPYSYKYDFKFIDWSGESIKVVETVYMPYFSNKRKEIDNKYKF